MTERDVDAVRVPGDSDPVALAFRHYLLALSAYKEKKKLLSMQSLVAETNELSQAPQCKSNLEDSPLHGSLDKDA